MTGLERAQEIADRAWEAADPRESRALAEEALAFSELCADAWVLLAGLEDDPAETVQLNRKALDAAERVLGRGFFEEAGGHFFDHPHGQRYFRARSALAVSLDEAGERREAISHLRAVLKLDPRDPPGVRRFLACWLSVEGRDDELEELLGAFPGDALAHVAYSRALLAYRRGDPSAEHILEVAQEDFPLVVPYLLGARAAPPLPMLTLDEEEYAALDYAERALEAWEATPGALGWLEENRGPSEEALSERPCRLVLVRNPSEESPARATFRAAMEGLIRARCEEMGLEVDLFNLPDGSQGLDVVADAGDLLELAEELVEDWVRGFLVEAPTEGVADLFAGVGVERVVVGPVAGPGWEPDGPGPEQG